MDRYFFSPIKPERAKDGGEAYLLEGYGLRQLIEGREGHQPLREFANIVQPPRTAAILVDAEFGKPYLTASQAFQQRPFPRKWVAEGRIPHGSALVCERGTVLLTRSGTVGRTTLAYTPHESSLISDDLLRITPREQESWGWVYAYLRAPKSRAMMMSQQYGHIVKHLEVGHVSDLPIPAIPNAKMADFNRRASYVLELREQAYAAISKAERHFESCLGIPNLTGGEGTAGFVVPSIRRLPTSQLRLDAAHYNPACLLS